MSRKARPSASLDAHLLHAADAGGAAGRGPRLGASVDDALEHARGLDVLAALIAEHETEHGEITDAEMRAAACKTAARSVPVRGRATARKPAR